MAWLARKYQNVPTETEHGVYGKSTQYCLEFLGSIFRIKNKLDGWEVKEERNMQLSKVTKLCS